MADRTLPKKTSSTSSGLISGTRSTAAVLGSLGGEVLGGRVGNGQGRTLDGMGTQLNGVQAREGAVKPAPLAVVVPRGVLMLGSSASHRGAHTQGTTPPGFWQRRRCRQQEDRTFWVVLGCSGKNKFGVGVGRRGGGVSLFFVPKGGALNQYLRLKRDEMLGECLSSPFTASASPTVAPHSSLWARGD